MPTKEISEIKKEKLVKEHEGLISKSAYAIWKAYNLPYDFLSDLVQEGYIGLLESIDNFDSDNGAKLSTYSFPRIWGSMIKFLKKNNFIHIPDKKLKKIIRILYYRNFLFTYLGRAPNSKEIAEATGYTEVQVENFEELSKMLKAYSLNRQVKNSSDEDRKELIEVIHDNFEIGPEKRTIRQENKNKLWEIIESLPQPMADIIKMRFGLKDGEEYSTRELSRRFNLTRYEVDKIEYDAIKILANQKEFFQKESSLHSIL